MLRDSHSILTNSAPPRTLVAVAVGMNPPDPAQIVIRVAAAAISDEDTERFERTITKHATAQTDEDIPDTVPARPAPTSVVRPRFGVAGDG